MVRVITPRHKVLSLKPNEMPNLLINDVSVSCFRKIKKIKLL